MKYCSVYTMLRDQEPMFCESLTDDEREYLDHVDDFESYEYIVWGGVYDNNIVTMKDSISGDVLLTQPMSDFLRDTLAFLQEEVNI